MDVCLQEDLADRLMSVCSLSFSIAPSPCLAGHCLLHRTRFRGDLTVCFLMQLESLHPGGRLPARASPTAAVLSASVPPAQTGFCLTAFDLDGCYKHLQ